MRQQWRRGSSVRAGTGAVARPRTGWPSLARRVVRSRRRVVSPRAAETHIRLQVDDRASDLAYCGSVHPLNRDGGTGYLTVERW